jgi:hypothetical protein
MSLKYSQGVSLFISSNRERPRVVRFRIGCRRSNKDNLDGRFVNPVEEADFGLIPIWSLTRGLNNFESP